MRSLSFILHPSSFILLFLLLPSLAATRDRRLLDYGWKFHLADSSLPGESSTPLTDLKYTPVQGTPSNTPPTPDATWKDASPGQDVFNGRVGFAWFSTTIRNPQSAIPNPPPLVSFDAVDDNATVFLNGQKIGSHEGWSESFDLPLNTAWNPAGPNTLSVLVENTAGIGGIKGASLKLSTQTVAANNFDDHAWRTVDVPHDFILELPVSPKNGDPNFGFHPPAVAWYRRHFTPDPSSKGQRTWLEFDGIYRNSKVFLNGQLLGAHPSGYTSFYFDATDSIKYNQDNVLAIRVDATSHEGWWYEGGGIYRHTWLTTLSPTHIAHWGTFVTTTIPSISNGTEVSATGSLPASASPLQSAPAKVTLKTTLTNESPKSSHLTLHSDILDANNQIVTTADTPADLSPNQSTTIPQKFDLPSAHLWSPDHPYLYHVVTTILQNDKELDRLVTPLGVRTFHFDPDHGFFLNGSPLKIQGTCNHQDFAGIGIALPDRIHEFKIQKLKEMGANAYRCSHHQYADELLDACDRIGMLVMDENRHLGESAQILDEAATLVQRDRNHPSVFLWSICNEEGLQGSAEGRRKAQAIKDVFNKYDGTRPVTAAMNAGWGGEGISNILDVVGFNYNYEQYDPFHKSHPAQPMMGSETASILTTRGEYQQDNIRGYMSSYNNGAESSWLPTASRLYMAGAFVWTGFDYRGEPTPFGWPNLNSHFGIMDLAGFPKDDFYYYQSAWTNKPVLHLFPHWNWAYPPRPEAEQGAMVEVRCYTNCDKVELFVNDKSQGTKTKPTPSGVGPPVFTWRVKWNPGQISAKGYKDGKEIETKIETAGLPAKILLTADRSTLNADAQDVALITATVVDADGRICPMADNAITFSSASDALHLLGTGNGDPSDHTPDHSPTRQTFHGHCLALLQSSQQPGPVTIRATCPDLPPTMLQLNLRPTALPPRVP
ncbi:MAG TPA: glycoside hydrolase family 2 TIM barrel-domain containing protein [Tepidisphaeraceae bacterium]|jgi:beta-galactosidase|nr:glycoside hydrolase family 2 TIM barrel-domain containing protein [Tepidisphaeraceae bacterium]